jgi:hypothetical protein
MKKPKAKFWVRQVVVVRDTNMLIRINRANLQSGHWFYWEANKSVGWEQSELRPLTAREIGPRWRKQ